MLEDTLSSVTNLLYIHLHECNLKINLSMIYYNEHGLKNNWGE